MRLTYWAVLLVLLSTSSVYSQVFSTSALNPTPIDSSGVITGSFPVGGGSAAYYFSVDLQKGDLVTEISLSGRANVDKKLEFTLLDADQHVDNSYYIYAGLDSNQDEARHFSIDTSGHYLVKIRLDGPESTSFRVQLGGSSIPSQTSHPDVAQTLSTSALFPAVIPPSGVIEGRFPGGGDNHNTYYYFSVDLKAGSLITQIKISGRSNVTKELELALLDSNMRSIGSYYILAGLDENAEQTKSFAIDSTGRYFIRLTLKGRENTNFKVEVGGSAFPAKSNGDTTGAKQLPGAIQQLKGPGQQPGAIQVPKGIQAIKQESLPCESRISVGADALFAFDRSDLGSDATETLEKLGPIIRRFGTRPVEIDGHTDAIGSLSYNQQLSEARAETVKRWLVKRDVIPASTPIKGYGKTRPVAPNNNPDGSDNPIGRQRNRRVEILINTCKPAQTALVVPAGKAQSTSAP